MQLNIQKAVQEIVYLLHNRPCTCNDYRNRRADPTVLRDPPNYRPSDQPRSRNSSLNWIPPTSARWPKGLAGVAFDCDTDNFTFIYFIIT